MLSRIFFFFLMFTMVPGHCELAIFSTLPKSGTMFIMESLYSSLHSHGWTFAGISLARFYDDTVVENALFVAPNLCSHGHIDASPHNLDVLKKHVPKMILHLRDPRQQLVSWLYHVEKHGKSHYSLWTDDICPPDHYYLLSFENKLDWQIKNFLPRTVEWIQNWMTVLDSGELGNLQVKVTRFEDLVVDTEKFFQEIYQYFNFPLEHMQYFDVKTGPRNKLHLRRGQIDEWKYVMTAAQIERVHEIVPLEMLTRFGWE